MGTVPTVYDWIAHDGLFATASDLEAGVGDVLSFLLNPPGAQCRRSVAQNLSNGVPTALPLDTEDFDTDNMHSTVTNPTRLTCNTPGQYLVSATVAYDPNATGQREIRIAKNGSTTGINGGRVIIANGGASIGVGLATMAIEVPLLAGDYLELVANQTSGGIIATSAINAIFPTLRARWVAP